MSNQTSEAHYKNLNDDDVVPKERPHNFRPTNLWWVMYACIATVCFALAAYILGITSVGGPSAKLLNSYGYLLISIIILTSKNIKF